MEELDKIDVCRVGTEVFLQKNVDGGLEHECIVDRNHADSGAAVPAWLATASDRAVHYIIRDEEEGLQELGHPSKEAKMLELFLGQGLLEEREGSVGNR